MFVFLKVDLIYDFGFIYNNKIYLKKSYVV